MGRLTLRRDFWLFRSGQLGDRFCRKSLIVLSDLWRGLFTLVLATLFFKNYFNLPLLISCYVLLAVGTALFNLISTSSFKSILTPFHRTSTVLIASGGSTTDTSPPPLTSIG